MERESIRLLADIATIIADSDDPNKTLDRIVRLVTRRCQVDVSSVYLLDEQGQTLELKATKGLKQEYVGAIHMQRDEGLTGMVLDRMEPLLVIDPSLHPRYKYFENSGEETYRTFLGVPLTFQQQVLGVLVVQTVSRDGVSEEDIPVFSAVASQMAAILAYGGVLQDTLKKKEGAPRQGKGSSSGKKKRKIRERRGVVRGAGASPGFAEGRAHYLGESVEFDLAYDETTVHVPSELARLEKAFQAAEQEIADLLGGMESLAHEDQAIMDAHGLFLKDRSFRKKIRHRITEGHSAEFALKNVVSEYVERFLDMEDPYLRDRRTDVEDIGKRILRHLLGVKKKKRDVFQEDTIVIAPHISPVDLVAIRQPGLKGVVLSRGGKTSHTVILAKSFEIPMVIGAADVFEVVRENDHIIVDGTSGLVFDEPPDVVVHEYERLREEKAREFRRLDVLREAKAVTKDGIEIQLGANIGLLSDLDLVKKYGADYIGLYRTEFPFLARRDFPSEQEQLSLYKKIVAGAGTRPVTIRTLDVGGDKFLSYLDAPKEQNPYLGWRSIRLSLDLDDIFRTQIRAILASSVFGNVRILFPMITSVGEIRRILTILSEEKEALRSRGVSFDDTISTGVMVEVPAAAKILPSLLPHVDFVSIGTNDLVQYVLAVDRNNEKVAEIYNPLHPAVIATVDEVVATCRSFGKKVGICGESASNPRCACLYLGMGVDRLSMNPASVPAIKHFVRAMSIRNARNILKQVRTMDDTGQIVAFLSDVIEGIPDQ